MLTSGTMQSHIAALILCFVIIGYINVAVCEGPWCYVCDKAVTPGSCGEIEKCGDDEQCYASSTGVSPTQYTAGCKKKQLCQGSVAGGNSPHGCEECCFGDHCNSDLCGGLPVPKGGNRLCLQCEAVRHPSQCTKVTGCSQDKYCSIRKMTQFQFTFYNLGCLEKAQCDGHMKGEEELSNGGFICCNDDLCNSHENNDHLTEAPTPPSTTTSLPTTTIRTGNIKCKKCSIVQQPSSCQMETECGPDQYCSVRKVFKLGMIFYDLGCEEKSECVGHMTTLGEDGFRCCNGDLCNGDVNPVTGSTTLATTALATPETSSSTTTTKSSSRLPTTTIRTGNLKCKNCEIVPQPSFCQEETRCGPDQYCSVRRIFKLGMITYDLGCEEKSECVGHMTTLGEAGFRCCIEDLCNGDVNPVTGSTTPAITAPATPESSTSSLPMAPQIKNANVTANVILGTTVFLECDATGNPEPSVTWTYDKQANPNAHPTGSTLAISSVNEKNEGIYKCVAKNTLGTKEGVVHLHVTEPVSVKGDPPIVIISPGMKIARLKCVGEGIPLPSVNLSKYGEDISADKSYHPVGSAEKLIMGITKDNMLKYDGVYVCNATNGQTSATAYQIVAINVTTPIDGQVPFNNISTTPLKAFHAMCPAGHAGPDGASAPREFNLDDRICPSARKVGLIDTNPGPVTWLIRPDGKAQFLNGSANVDFENANSTAAITTPTTSLSSSARVTPTQYSSMLPLSSLQPSTVSNIQKMISLTTTSLEYQTLMAMTTSLVTRVPLNSIQTNTQSENFIPSLSSFGQTVTPTSKSQFLQPAASSRGVSAASGSPSLSLAVTPLPSGVTSSSDASVSSKGVPSSGIAPSSQTPSLAFVPSSVTSSSRPSAGTYASTGSVSSSGSTSVSLTPSVTFVPSSVPSSPQASEGTYASTRAVSSYGSTSMSLTPSLAFVPSSVTISSQASAGTYASTRAVSSSEKTSMSPSPSLAFVPSSVPPSSPQASVGTYASTRAVSSSGSTSMSLTPSVTFVPSSVPSSPQASGGTYASTRAVSSYGSTSMSLTPSLAFVPSSVTISSQASAGTYASTRAVSSSEKTSMSPSPSLAFVPSSVPPSSPQASVGTYASARAVSSSGMASMSPSLSLAFVPSSVPSPSQASTGTYASTRVVSSSGSASMSPSPSLAFVPSSVPPSSPQASVGTYASARSVSSSGVASMSPSPSLAYVPSSVQISSRHSAGTYASTRAVSSSGSTSMSPSPSLAFVPSSVPSPSQASTGTYDSARAVSSSGVASMSPSPSLAYVPSSVQISSRHSAGTYASTRGVSSSGSTSMFPSPSVALVSSSVPSSSQANAGTYASSRAVSLSGITSMSPSPSLASLPSSVTTSLDASAGIFAVSRDVSSSGIASSSPISSLLPSSTSLSQASVGTYASTREVSSSGVVLGSPSIALAMTSLQSSVSSSSEINAGASAFLRAVSSYVAGSSSSAPVIEPSSTMLLSQTKTGEMTGSESSSKAMPSISSTFPMPVTAPSVTSAPYLLPSQNLMNKHISSYLTAFQAVSFSSTPTLTPTKTPTSSLMSLRVAVSSVPQTTIPGLLLTPTSLSQIISPSSSILSNGHSTAIPGTYKQEPTTGGTTVTTTEPRVAPHISNPSQNVNVLTGEDVVLSCNVTGVPEPSVTWYYDNQNVFNAKPDGNKLRLSYVTKENNGDYTCVAENNLGQANGSVHVQTHEPVTISTEKPIVILVPGGFVTQLKCAAKGDPTPAVTWSKYGGMDSTDTNFVDTGDGELLIMGVDKTNLEHYEGIYICHADNGVESQDAYVVAAGNISETLDSSKKFSDFNMKPGASLHATCVPGTVDTDGTPLSSAFGPSDSICDSARKAGVISKDSGPITWFIRLDGKAEFVDETKGATVSIADALTTRGTPVSDPSNAVTTAPLICKTCHGPTCVVVPGQDTPCSDMTPFCMNTIIVKADESRSVTKSCASSGDCETKWWQQTSDRERCTNMQPGNPYAEDFTCSFCCITPGCNKDMIPKTDTLYKGNA